MTTPLRVMVVMPLAEQRGGAEKMLQHLLQYAPQDRVLWHVVFLEDGPMVRWVEERNLPVAVFPAGRLRNPWQYARAVGRLVHLTRQWRPHVVFSWMTKAHLYAGVAAKLARLPATWYHHSISDGSMEQKLITRIPAAWVAVPSGVAREAQVALGGCPPCHVAYPGIDTAEFRPENMAPASAVRQELAIPAERTIIGTVARLQRWKGVHVFLRAAAVAAQTHPLIHVLVVGGAHFSEPEYQEELKRLAQELGLADRVTFTGHRQDVARLMNAFDVFVHSSSMPEPGGMTVMEAMALGKPLIATRAGGPTETVIHGETGLLVQPNDEEDMAKAIVRLMSERSLASRFGEAGRRRARRFFSAEVMSRRIVELLEQVRPQ